MSDFNSRLQSASDVIDSYLQKENNKDSKTYLEQILNVLGIDNTSIGIETLEAESTTYEDFESAFKNNNATDLFIPQPRLKLAWSILKGKKESKEKEVDIDIPKIIKTMQPIGAWPDFDLLQKYGKDGILDIEEELRKRSKGRHCIVFLENGDVDVENSLYMFRKARYQETPKTYLINGEIKQVFKIGDFPANFFYECPIHKNVLLVDGYCEECGKKWDVENTNLMSLLRIVKESTPSDPIIYKEMDFKELSKNFPAAYRNWENLKTIDRLPSLKNKVSISNGSDPFRVITHRSF